MGVEKTKRQEPSLAEAFGGGDTLLPLWLRMKRHLPACATHIVFRVASERRLFPANDPVLSNATESCQYQSLVAEVSDYGAPHAKDLLTDAMVPLQFH